MNRVSPTNMVLGRHVLAEFWGCNNTEDPRFVEIALTSAAHAAGAKILGSECHDFGDGLGVTCVVILAESHISIHSWPEFGYSAIDIFMCGDAQPMKAIDSLRISFEPEQSSYIEIPRGASSAVFEKIKRQFLAEIRWTTSP